MDRFKERGWVAQYETTSIADNGRDGADRRDTPGPVACPDCRSEELRSKGRYVRTVRHETWGLRHVFLLEARNWLCGHYGRHFRQQFLGTLKWQRASERFRRMIFFRHWHGISPAKSGQRGRLRTAKHRTPASRRGSNDWLRREQQAMPGRIAY